MRSVFITRADVFGLIAISALCCNVPSAVAVVTIAGNEKGATVGTGGGVKLAHTFHAGPVDITPGIGVGAGYNDNIFAAENAKKGSFVGNISPEILFGVNNPDSAYQLLYARRQAGAIQQSPG
ncbi:MAG: hypothetical protein COW18_01825 [Zetaproteobacteria bacterium CG12_big_fil_rev_8_21_14_0_65_54_13]|nr:MAG: hypothetical protein COX55_00630 [Zetaproteobacteria bacterium CG23_combo_of_CG06-09_8_20_14_all_54_7]PIW51324.1 MAG: hypothetical protein COW18_01825 [Zetaproteobacteria bacterium CG12_big_fil_rev_8_21_14_0_65_54_13]PIX53334.1 MAG: hypothetical protein COZ50_14050 [Zetaproteobacteria bacterium CG_4_10_14_3_um_filter_54_28]PJA29630.1 MAG: hypothetical protein CO188_06440 [Zetaproteobacteria bacterium CG_4_9_14_3_um_filter_54_145]